MIKISRSALHPVVVAAFGVVISLPACGSGATGASSSAGGSASGTGESSGGAGGTGGELASGVTVSSSASGSSSSTGGGSGCVVGIDHVIFVGPTGKDTAAGTESDPFATVNHALAKAVAGDTVFVRDGVYSELVTFPGSGAAGAPIALRAYCGEHPVLDATGLGSGDAQPALVSIVDRSHVVVDGFELRNLTGTGNSFPAGIWVRGSVSDVVIRNNDVHHITAPNGGKDTGAHGIAVYGEKTTPSEDVHLTGNLLHDLVLGPSEAMVVNGNVRKFEVLDNTVHDVNNIAFDFIGFESDVCASCSQADVTDVDSVNRVREGLVRGNTAFNMTTATNPAYGGEKAAACFYVDGGAGILIERNVAHDCDLGVELASEHYQKATRAVIVRDNFLYDNDVTGIATGGYDPGIGPGGGSAEQCWIVNNTIVNSSRNGWADAGVLLQNRNVNNHFENNIVVATIGGSTVSNGGLKNTGNLIDYNLYFNGALSGVIDGGHSISKDPLLISPSTGDLHLSAGSPAIDGGDDMVGANGAPQDLDIDGEPRKGHIDIGADER
ncbi:MAG: DUF1565 domain-containing protein [Byssovorax sp.]